MRRRLTEREKRNRRKKIIIIPTLCLLFAMTAGYAAFQTNIRITAKGNIKNIKEKVDSKVPTNELLFWGQADNEENTLTTLKDKSGNNNDGTMYGFDNNNSSGYTDDGLVFDGINDYVNIGLANYDFQNSISYVAYVKIYSYETNGNNMWPKIFSNQERSGSALDIQFSTHKAVFEINNGVDSSYVIVTSEKVIELNQYYTIIGTFDGANGLIYIDGVLDGNSIVNQLTVSQMPLLIGANPDIDTTNENINMALKEAMVYDRALTEDEVKTITEGFEKKYN